MSDNNTRARPTVTAARATALRGAATGTPRLRLSTLAILAAASLPWAASALAGEWDPQARLSLSAIVSDNPLLRPDGDERADIVLRTAPSFGLKRRGPRLTLEGTYSPVFVGYLNESRPEALYNTLGAQGTYEAVDDRVFIDARARMAQTFISPFGAQPSDVSTSTVNRTEVRSFGVSPYVRGALAGGARYQLRDDFQYSTYTAGTLPDITSNMISGFLSGSPGSYFVPSVDGMYRTTQYGSGSEFTSSSGRAKLLANVDPEFAPYLSAGYEDNEFRFSSFSGPIYGGGFLWKPSPRTSVDLNVEKRYFGTSFSADASYRTRLSLWRVRAYRRDRVSQQPIGGLAAVDTRDYLSTLLQSRIPDDTARQAEVDRLMNTGLFPATLSAATAFSSPRVLLEQGIEPSLAMLGVRNNVVLSVYWRRTTPLTGSDSSAVTDVFNTVNGFTRKGFSVSWSHTVTARMSLSTGFDRATTESIRATAALPATLRTRQRIFRVGANYRLTPDTSVDGSIRVTQLVSEDSGAAAVIRRDERAILFSLTHQFF